MPRNFPPKSMTDYKMGHRAASKKTSGWMSPATSPFFFVAALHGCCFVAVAGFSVDEMKIILKTLNMTFSFFQECF